MIYSDDESQLLLSDDRFETATSEIEELLSKVKFPILECTQLFVIGFLAEYGERKNGRLEFQWRTTYRFTEHAHCTAPEGHFARLHKRISKNTIKR